MLPADDGETRANFDDIGWSLVTVFQVLTGENWNDVIIMTMTSTDTVVLPVLYFLAVIFVGDFMILNLFLAILMARFEDSLDDDGDDDDGAGGAGDDKDKISRLTEYQTGDSRVLENGVNLAVLSTKVVKEDSHSTLAIIVPGEIKAGEGDTDGIQGSVSDPHHPPGGRSCCLFAPTLGLRRAAYRFSKNNAVNGVILFLVFVSSITLAIDDPSLSRCDTAQCASFKEVLYYFDLVITVFFTLEMVIKMFALGITGIGFKKKTSTKAAAAAAPMAQTYEQKESALGQGDESRHWHRAPSHLLPQSCCGWWCLAVRNKGAYLLDAWNVLDFVVVSVSIASLIPGGGGGVRALRMLRSLRALRPLRAVQRLPGLKLVVSGERMIGKTRKREREGKRDIET
jgi:hypothetical protein